MQTSIETVYLNFPATDDYPLAATLFIPRRPHAVALISSATGAPQRYYAEYARYLAQQGFVVMTYDYRGIAGSRWPAAHPQARPRMSYWGERDLAGALEQLKARHPQLPIVAIGHSVGGQILGLAPNNHLVTAQLGIAAQNGYWGHWPLASRPVSWAYWNIAVPGAVALYGRLPEKFFGCEIPGGIASEWASWCRNPQFIGARKDAHFDSYAGRMRFYAVEDDGVWAPPGAVAALARLYRGAETELRLMRPTAHGMKSLGHFGFFRYGTPISLWRETAEWLRDAAHPGLRKAA